MPQMCPAPPPSPPPHALHPIARAQRFHPWSGSTLPCHASRSSAQSPSTKPPGAFALSLRVPLPPEKLVPNKCVGPMAARWEGQGFEGPLFFEGRLFFPSKGPPKRSDGTTNSEAGFFPSSSSEQKLSQKKTQSNSGSRLEKRGFIATPTAAHSVLAVKPCKFGFCQQRRGFQRCSKTGPPKSVGSPCLSLSSPLCAVSPVPSCWD